MKYYSRDRLQDFEFHDSKFSLVSFEPLPSYIPEINGCYELVISAKYLNVHKDAAPNNLGTDMEIKEAIITFNGFRINEFEPSRVWKRDENGNLYTDDPLVIYKGETARAMFEAELKDSISVVGITNDNDEYELGAMGIDPYFSVRFTFSSVCIEWDDYSKKAWYELHKSYIKKLTLATRNGDISVDASITCHDEEVYYEGEKIESPSVFVGINYNDMKYFGDGKDYLWVDAFADLQKKLPIDVKIKCCLTCRYGNMNIYGNKPGEVLCMQDINVTKPEDMWQYMSDWDEIEKRSRDYTDVCENYREQSNDYYTYSDYPYYFEG